MISSHKFLVFSKVNRDLLTLITRTFKKSDSLTIIYPNRHDLDENLRDEIVSKFKVEILKLPLFQIQKKQENFLNNYRNPILI